MIDNDNRKKIIPKMKKLLEVPNTWLRYNNLNIPCGVNNSRSVKHLSGYLL